LPGEFARFADTLLPESAAKRSAAALALRAASVIMSGLMELRPFNLYMMPWDQVLDGDVAVAKARGFDLCSEDPAAENES
jgi:hypothetical protein